MRDDARRRVPRYARFAASQPFVPVLTDFVCSGSDETYRQ